MKKFTTIALLLALSSTISPSVFAADGVKAEKSSCEFLPNSPDQHVVVKGDTLWGISQLFLEHAWCWPEVWGMNQADIKNPHWIYPGQVVYFDRAAGRLRLGKSVSSKESDNATVRLSPQIRSENVNSDAIASIPANVIEPFLSQPIVLDALEIKEFTSNKAPRIVATQEGHVNIGKLEKAYAIGDLKEMTNFQVYRPSTPLIDPETKKILGYESFYVGSVKLIKAGEAPNEAHSFLVTKSKEEMTVGDLLLPVPSMEANNYVPHPPVTDVRGRVVSIYGGVAMAGQNQTVSVNLGAKEGLDIGTVLKLYHHGETIVDKTRSKSNVKLPDEEYGALFIYRVFNNISYGLIMHVNDSAQVGDIVKSPT